MQELYCWRCKAVFPMLDEDEYQLVSAQYQLCMKSPVAAHLVDEGFMTRFTAVRELYSRITGSPEIHHNAIMHHRRTLYGDPCRSCGKPLRTPQAALCAACGTPKTAG